MLTTVAWSGNLRLAVKQHKAMKAIAADDVPQITTVEEHAIQKQLLQKPEDVSASGYWW